MKNIIKIRNSNGKLVCIVDKVNKSVEISLKGILTTIQFCNDIEIKVTNINTT